MENKIYGHELEDWLLSRWGAWVRSSDFELKEKPAMSLLSDKIRGEVGGDDLMLQVDKMIASLDRRHVKIIKRRYLSQANGEEDDIAEAIGCFAQMLEKRGVA